MNRDFDSLCVLGPTASGKTKYAVKMAYELGEWHGDDFIHKAEILSADSRQVYRGMDIGTGKDLIDYTINTERGDVEIPYHLIDIVDCGEKYNIFRYQRDFSKAYSQIIERGNMPIICGGSGLYIAAATQGYELKEVLPDEKLRGELEKYSMDELIEMLVKLKSGRGELPHNDTDFDTKKRVIRAIEIAKSFSNIPENEKLILPKKTKFIGIDIDRDTRNKRIDTRLAARLNEGMIAEVEGLLRKGISSDSLIYYGLEYKYVTMYLIGEIQYQQMVDMLQTAIHQFAKRQMTWFRGMERKGTPIEWINI